MEGQVTRRAIGQTRYLTSIRECSGYPTGYYPAMNTITLTGRQVTDPDETAPVPGNARRGGGEIGGRRFRVGLSNAGIPSRRRKRRKGDLIAMAGGWVLAVGVSVYSFMALTPARSATVSTCNAASTHTGVTGGTAAAAKPGAFALNIFNSTNRDNLAANTAAQLQQRGFAVDLVTNDPLKSGLTIPAQVWGAESEMSELREVAAQVPGAQIETDSRHDPSVDLVLGAGFTSLASPHTGC
jgi:LytR cell envelope-related transcriptional attenuator